MNHSTKPFSIQIAEDCAALGVRRGGVLLVHSSLRSLHLPPGDPQRPEHVILGLLEALGPQGTLLFPALSYETVRSYAPFFDVLRTPVCVGALPEYFRTRPGTLRSVHPTHSVCGVGARAEELLADHQLDTTPCGPHSPFSRLMEVQGQILFLGCGLRPNTSMHAIEEHVVPPYLFADPLEYTIWQADGVVTKMVVRRHDFRNWEQRYDRLEDVMRNGLRKGVVLGASTYLVDTAEMWPAALAAYRRDPLYFVDAVPVDDH